jgi:hypothetical protein
LKGGATATRRLTAEEVRELVAKAPPFLERYLDEGKLSSLCAEYERITGVHIGTAKKRAFLASVARSHGEDFIPFTRDHFAATGTETNLLGFIRGSPRRTFGSTAQSADPISLMRPAPATHAEPPPRRDVEVGQVDVAEYPLDREPDTAAGRLSATPAPEPPEGPPATDLLWECFPGLLYGPLDRPPFDPTSPLRWDDRPSNPHRTVLRARHEAAVHRDAK